MFDKEDFKAKKIFLMSNSENIFTKMDNMQSVVWVLKKSKHGATIPNHIYWEIYTSYKKNYK